MRDARAEYARRWNDRITLRCTPYWDAEVARPAVPPRRPATIVDAWWEALSLPLVARRDDGDRRAA